MIIRSNLLNWFLNDWKMIVVEGINELQNYLRVNFTDVAKVATNNKFNNMFKIEVGNMFGIPGVIKYFKTFNSIDDDIIHIDECYKTYIDKVYNGNVSGVDKHSFVKTLFENILNYFKERLAELKLKIDECNEKIDIISKGLDGASQHSLEEAQLQRDIYLNLDSFNDLRLPGILDEDLISIYEDLKEIVCREHSKVCSDDTAVRKTK